ncbi:putative PEP-binding protein [Yinghuangia seranimata]|uniref:putative PEP-binding protein n=1 Tax=Yinghuangia seranimata TaxID=408067 RepID=UPI00248B700D|nr:putative PEP-binding protein [Yinghuangia seranimata]MDI2130266.1 phosphoenolpyruvate-utilizing N-terminal domain-containing protein [Yinghuangia seranimata]
MSASLVLDGVGASPGVAVGRVVSVDRLEPSRAGGEPHDVGAAFQAVADELYGVAERLRGEGRPDQADIVEVGALIAEDPSLRGLAAEFVGGGLSVGEAVVAAANRHADALVALGDPLFADRAADVRQIGRRAAAWLRGGSRPLVRGVDVVLVGEELAAADVLMTGRGPVAAVSARGGPTGHLAVVARALGMPLVLGADADALRAAEGRRVLVDGDRGRVVVDPAVGDVVPDLSDTPAPARPVRPTHTRDGHRIVVLANVGGYREAVAARASGAEGVGLLRTELPFLAADHWPDADEHEAVLVPLLRDGPDGVVVVRTFDFAGDKRPPFLAAMPPDADRSDAVLRTQFAGVLAAAAKAGRDVRLLVPMVRDATDFARCRHLLAEVCRRLGVPHPPLGAMVESPGAVADAEPLAAGADFLSLGTNDLTAALLGRSRHDPALTPDLTARPVVLRALRKVVAKAAGFGRSVSVCGVAAADPKVLPLLVGLGVDTLSVAPPALDGVRDQVRALDRTHCQELVRTLLASDAAP